MRSALTTLDGIDGDDVDVDYGAKTATVNIEGANVTPADLVAAFKDTRFSATAR